MCGAGVGRCPVVAHQLSQPWLSQLGGWAVTDHHLKRELQLAADEAVRRRDFRPAACAAYGVHPRPLQRARGTSVWVPVTGSAGGSRPRAPGGPPAGSRSVFTPEWARRRRARAGHFLGGPSAPNGRSELRRTEKRCQSSTDPAADRAGRARRSACQTGQPAGQPHQTDSRAV